MEFPTPPPPPTPYRPTLMTFPTLQSTPLSATLAVHTIPALILPAVIHSGPVYKEAMGDMLITTFAQNYLL